MFIIMLITIFMLNIVNNNKTHLNKNTNKIKVNKIKTKINKQRSSNLKQILQKNYQEKSKSNS